MRYWLCMNIRKEAKPEQVAKFIDELEYPFEWMELPVSESKLLVVRCDSFEHQAAMLRNVPDARIMTAFGFSQVEENDGVR